MSKSMFFVHKHDDKFIQPYWFYAKYRNAAGTLTGKLKQRFIKTIINLNLGSSELIRLADELNVNVIDLSIQSFNKRSIKVKRRRR